MKRVSPWSGRGVCTVCACACACVRVKRCVCVCRRRECVSSLCDKVRIERSAVCQRNHLRLGRILEPPNPPGLECDWTQLKGRRAASCVGRAVLVFASLRKASTLHNCCSLVVSKERLPEVDLLLALASGPWTEGLPLTVAGDTKV